ncbi:hypothetical protein TH63_13330 [Rufibacter radiotolerans]|uniref:Uncharacterized protein n=1 Tax=Rufibacter radiotolerans TaxID=1379910 RepID=A0A0H4VR17_9BACT|nr:hypothetical protein TH63_13330 [Rufibacter radiotolerans]
MQALQRTKQQPISCPAPGGGPPRVARSMGRGKQRQFQPQGRKLTMEQIAFARWYLLEAPPV